MTEKHIRELSKIAFHLMQEKAEFETEPLLYFCTADNGNEVCRKLCKEICSESFEEQDYNTIIASAHPGIEKDAILVRTDLDFSNAEMIHYLLHEMAHIFLTHNEMDDGETDGQTLAFSFYDKYCRYGSGEENGYLCSGYAIWREFSAELMAWAVDPQCMDYSLRREATRISELLGEVRYGDPNAKGLLSHCLIYGLLSTELASATTWEEAQKRFGRYVPNRAFDKVYEMIYHQMRTDVIYKITPKFISELGKQYIVGLLDNSFNFG